MFSHVNHTRFEHSIGVAHLSAQLLKHIQMSQPEYKVTDRQVLIIFLAGLLHDVGHGPYSHCYDEISTETHEIRSCRIAKELTNHLLNPEEQQIL